MNLSVKKKQRKRISALIDWLLHIFGYTVVFILVMSLFDSIKVDTNNPVLWSFIIVLIIYLLNKTVKPILVTLTIPITGLTLGLFYPFINVFILKLADWILKDHFQVTNIWIAVFAAILLSITSIMMDSFLKKIIKKVHLNG